MYKRQGQVNQTVEFTYLVNNSESNVKIGEAIQADLSKVGINLKMCIRDRGYIMCFE